MLNICLCILFILFVILSRITQCLRYKRLLKHLVEMRVFVSFEGSVHTFEVNTRETVGDIKETLRERFGLTLKNHRGETVSFVSLLYQGSNLHDDWIYSDLSISPGSILVCRLEKQVEPSLTVHCINYDDRIVYKNSFNVWETSVGTLRTMIQDSTGVPVSAFRLYSKTGLELYDCHLLKVYGIDAGDIVTMEIWHDVSDVIRAARDNEITDTLGSLTSFHDGPQLMRYQLQVGLFTAAHYGYHQLAIQLMKCGARPDEPVGQHPSRDWCRESAHVDHVKTPAHEAAQHGRLKCLRYFLIFNYAILICKDAHGLTPSNIARRYKQKECFKLLVAEQFRIPSVHPEINIHVYSRVRKWCDRARMRARLNKDKTAMLLLTNAEIAQKRAVVGQKVQVDGYGGLDRNKRKVKSAPSQSHASSELEHSASHKTVMPEIISHRAKSDVMIRMSSKNKINKSLDSNPDETSRRHNSNIAPISRNLHRRQESLYVPDSMTALKSGAARPNMRKSINSTRDNNSSPDSPCVSRSGNRASRSSLRLEHVQTCSARTQQEQYLDKLKEFSHGQNARYIWKSLDDEEKVVVPMDEIGSRTTCAIIDQRDATVTSINQDAMPVLGRSKIEESRNGVAPCRDTDDPRRKVTASKSGSNLGGSRHADSPVKRRSTQSRKFVRNSFVESNADKCLRVACETFRKKSWLSQLQMALAMNTNMYKHRALHEGIGD